ncbi:MAG: YceI family protein [Rhodanobacteraceae bacterium]
MTQSVRYDTDPAHTFVTFGVRHFNTSTGIGRFDQVEGHVELDDATRAGTAEITIETNSINSGTPKFDEHLRSDAFFNAAKYPQARFVSQHFTYEGEKLASVEGKLTLLGVTRPVTLHGIRFNRYDSPVWKTQVCGGDFETTIKRSQWGMTWGLDIGVPDDVKLTIQIEAVRQ